MRGTGCPWSDEQKPHRRLYMRVSLHVKIRPDCGCIEVYDSDATKGHQQLAYKQGVFSRPFLNYLYAMIPYVIEENELIKILRTMKERFSKKC